jgi:hypothetical protein
VGVVNIDDIVDQVGTRSLSGAVVYVSIERMGSRSLERAVERSKVK